MSRSTSDGSDKGTCAGLNRPSRRERFQTLSAIVDAPNDLPLEQWMRLHERALESGADLLFEVGRGYGNSTVVLTEAAHSLGAKVVSVGNDEPPAFETITWPRLAPVVGVDWRRPLSVVQADIQEQTLPACQRCFLFWDAHGHAVADTMLNRLIPGLPDGSLVVVHDVPTVPEAERSPLPLDLYPYRWRQFVSAFDELPLIGAWLEEHQIAFEQDTGMLTFAT
jgi:cephalosporin hydroxylase